MAERASARAWRADVESRTTPVGERRRAAVAERPQLSLVVTRTEGGRPRRARRDHDAPRRDPATGRRSVTITGQRAAPAPRRRPDTSTRVGPRPDRIAMWAFVMGIFLMGVATATADAAPL
jgi:hypothetical protein